MWRLKRAEAYLCTRMCGTHHVRVKRACTHADAHHVQVKREETYPANTDTIFCTRPLNGKLDGESSSDGENMSDISSDSVYAVTAQLRGKTRKARVSRVR